MEVPHASSFGIFEERMRVDTLEEYDVLQSPPSGAFDRVTRLASRLFDVPIALVNFIDENEQWCLSSSGIDVPSTSRDVSFCTHAIQSDDVMVVTDAREDARFADNPFVTGKPGIRFYAGAPLIAPNGYRLGTVCLIDRKPHADFDASDREALADLAGVVMDELNLRRFAVDLNASREAFKASSAHTTQILESITDAFFALDDRWTFSYVNARAELMLDTPREALIGANIWDAFPEAVGSTFQEEYERAVEKQEMAEFVEYYPPLDTWFDVRAYPFQGGLSVYFQDVTARIEAERKLEHEEDLVEAIAETSVAAIVTVDADETITFANPRAEEILGLSEDTVGQPHHTVGALSTLDGEPMDLEDWPYPQIVETGEQIHDTRLRFTRHDGDERLLSINGAPLTNPDGGVRQVVFSIVDITDQVEHEAQLRDARDEAERASRLKSSFLANMSHDVRTPLSSILSITEVLAVHASDDVQEHLALIKRSSLRLLDTIDSVLDLSKIESGTATPDYETIDVADELWGTIEIFRPQVDQKDIALEVTIPDEPVSATLDTAYLHRISDNLIGNAIKFTPEGGRIHVSLHAMEKTIELRVSDTGVGIEPAFIGDLFEVFTRGTNSTEEQGSGLGLAITKRLVELLDGTVSVASSLGEGTTFTVRLPRFGDAAAEGSA